MIKVVFVLVVVSAVVLAQRPFVARPGLFNNPYNPVRPFVPNGVLPTPYIPIVDYSNEINVDGSYRYSFATADGKVAEESGYLKDVTVGKDGEPVGVQVVQGSYSYTAPDGTPVQVSYIADENGFQPTSIRIPSDGRINGNPLIPRANILGSPYRNPFNVGKYNSPFVNSYNYDKPIPAAIVN